MTHDVVIVGGGIAGASLAYHLATVPLLKVMLLERGEIASGTTSHAPGLIGRLRSAPVLAEMAKISASLYAQHTDAKGVGFQQVGSLRLAQSRVRLDEIVRQGQQATERGIEAHLLSPREIARRWPQVKFTAIEGGLYLPQDGSADARPLVWALAEGARQRGVELALGTETVAIETKAGEVTGVRTDTGFIAARNIVLASGLWSRALAQTAGEDLPIVPLALQYGVTRSVPSLAEMVLPNVRNPDERLYARQIGSRVLYGIADEHPVPWLIAPPRVGKRPAEIPFDTTRFVPAIGALERTLDLEVTAEPEKTINGLEAFTPDGEIIVGPAPRTRGLWAVCGMCGHGMACGGGAGAVLAKWIVDGDPGMDASVVAWSRFAASLTEAELVSRVTDAYAGYYRLS